MIDQIAISTGGGRRNRLYGAQAFHEALLTAGFAGITAQARFHTVCLSSAPKLSLRKEIAPHEGKWLSAVLNGFDRLPTYPGVNAFRLVRIKP
jgi:hypothetical protein